MGTDKEVESCRLDFTELGFKLSGDCAEGFESAFKTLYDISKSMGLELSAYLCTNGKTGKVEDVYMGAIGTPTSTTLPKVKPCRLDQIQIPVHTHPTSGSANFSNTDAVTIARRTNEGIDDGHCVVGDDATSCLLKVSIERND